jgi:glycosyltransferase involved in cell wall biosynthesis
MTTAAQLVSNEPDPSETVAHGNLTLCLIGAADSTHVAARARCFAEMGHRVYLITETPSTGGINGVTELVPALDHDLARKLWFRVILWSCRKMGGRTVDDAWRVAAFIRLLRSCRPDIVHVHFAYSYYGWLAGLLGCQPLVVTVMGGDILFAEQGDPTPAGTWLTLELLRKANYITSKSHYLTAELDRLGGFGHKAERIVWGIPVAKFRRLEASGLRRSLGLADDCRVILSPKILRPLYRVHLVVEAMALVVRVFPDAVLLVTEYSPDPDYRSEIVRLIASLQLGQHVILCGRVAHADMPLYYSLAEISVAVPSSDGLPQTLLESMACETPNLLSKLPRYEEIVRHEDSAYFVEATASAIASGIIRLLGDDLLRARLARNALDIVRREGDLEEQSRRVERRYRELAAKVSPRVVRASALLAAWRSFPGWRQISQYAS